MKRGGQAGVRDKLRRTMGEVRNVCLDCPTRKYRVEWNGSRYLVVVWHDPMCPVFSSAHSWNACNEHLRYEIMQRGMGIPEYDMGWDGDLVTHRV